MEQLLNLLGMLSWLFGVGYFHLRLVKLVFSIVVIKQEPEPQLELSKEAIEAIRRKWRMEKTRDGSTRNLSASAI